MGVTHIGGHCVNTSTFKSERGRSQVDAKGFDINQPSHVAAVQRAMRNANGGTITLKLGRFAED